MNNQEFTATVYNRHIKFPAIDGITDMEMDSIVKSVEKRMTRVSERLDIVDTSRIAIIAAFEFAAEVYTLSQRAETESGANTRRIDEMISKLESALK
jgi:cell division protein ZapA (FtsZ GTPase activity inhibitor)